MQLAVITGPLSVWAGGLRPCSFAPLDFSSFAKTVIVILAHFIIFNKNL
jgi:hypothetical protein